MSGILNNNVKLLNQLFEFREQKGMQEDCMLDVIVEFCSKHDIEPEHLCAELADYDIFKEIIEKDLVKFKFSKNEIQESNMEIWK